MLLSLVIVALAAVAVNSQVPPCIPGAQVNAAGKCACVNAGNPKLCCYDPASEKQCRAVGDPVLTTFFNRKLSLDFPCGTLMSTSTVPGSCKVDVYSANNPVDQNLYFTSRIQVVLGDGAVAVAVVAQDRVVYKNTASYQTVYLTAGASAQTLSSTGVDGDVTVKLDTFGRVEINACETTIFVRVASGTDKFQQTTGACVNTKLSATLGAMCAIDKTFVDAADYQTYAIRPMMEYWNDNGYRLQTTSDTTYCMHFQRISTQNCENNLQRSLAYTKCSPLIHHSVVRRCIIGSPLGFLGHCMATYCTGRKDLCDVIKGSRIWRECAPDLAKCDTWPKYIEVNQYVAGEGGDVEFGAEVTEAAKSTTEFNPGEEGIIFGKQETTQKQTTEGFDFGGGF